MYFHKEMYEAGGVPCALNVMNSDGVPAILIEVFYSYTGVEIVCANDIFCLILT